MFNHELFSLWYHAFKRMYTHGFFVIHSTRDSSRFRLERKCTILPCICTRTTQKRKQSTLYMSLRAFHLGQIISITLGDVDHEGKHGTTWTPIRGETSETDHTQNCRSRYGNIYQIQNVMCYSQWGRTLRRMSIGKWKMPRIYISSQENDHATNVNFFGKKSDKQQWSYITFSAKYFRQKYNLY